MAIKKEYDIENVLPDMDSWLLPRENGMMLSDYQVRVLNRNNINYKNYNNISEILFAINEMNLDDDELEDVARDLDELNYYSNEVQ